MSEENLAITKTNHWKPKVLIIGALIGASVGLTAAYLLIQRSQDDEKLSMTVGDGVKIGVLVFGLLRSISALRE